MHIMAEKDIEGTMKQIFAIICAFILFGTTVYAEDIQEPEDLYAQAAVLMDADSGRVLFSKNKDEILPNASTTKIMTCILALEEGNMTDVVKASANAATQPKVHLGMKEDESFYLKDLLYSLMLESHNDSAVAIAEHIAGSTEKFSELMNKKATEIGCKNTYFITPNGLDATDDNGIHSTTACDLANIMSYCINQSPKKDEFISITATPTYTFSNADGNRTFSCSNHNSFLTMMDGAISGKTGFTGKAGYCYVGAVKRDERTFVVSLLACGWPNNKNYKWKDTKKLMEYAINNYEYQTIKEELQLKDLFVENGVPKTDSIFDKAYVKLKVDFENKDNFTYLLRSDEKIETQIIYHRNVQAPLQANQPVGKIIYLLEGDKIKEYNVVTAEKIEERNLSWVFEQIVEKYFQIN